MKIILDENEINRALVRWIHKEVLGTCGNLMGHDVQVNVHCDPGGNSVEAECTVTKRTVSKPAKEMVEVIK